VKKYKQKIIPEIESDIFDKASTKEIKHYDLIKYAEYNNFGNRKRNDTRHILGYLNFKVKAKINNQYKFLRITVIIANTGKFYYHHEINIYKK